MKFEEHPDCLLCRQPGELRYLDLPDRLFGVPGRFRLRTCRRCGLLWLDPRPAAEDLAECYREYYTHQPAPPAPPAAARRRLASLRDALRMSILCGHYGYRHLPHRHGSLCRLGPLLASLPLLRYRAVYDDMRERFPPYSPDPDALLVDVGCGRGDYLRRMQGLGWKVLGVESDPSSGALAAAAGIPIRRGTLREAALPEGTVTQVTFQHVLEHLPDPAAEIRESYRILKPGGRLVLYTPNAGSLCHRLFRESWMALDPPRHLCLFSGGGLGELLGRSPFRRHRVVSVSKAAKLTYDFSLALRRGTALPGQPVPPAPGRRLFGLLEGLLCGLGLGVGEELEAVAWK